MFRVQGMFDPPSSVMYTQYSMSDVANAAHLELAEYAARQGVTLLKNSALKYERVELPPV